MKRRAFIAMAGTAMLAPLAAWAEPPQRVRRLGMLMSTRENDPVARTRVAEFRAGLKQLGWRGGQTLQIEWRGSGDDIAATRRYAAELVQLAPDILLGAGTPATVALKQ